MKLEDMFGAISTQNAEDISRAVSMVLDAKNLSATEHDAFISGYFAGLGYAFSCARYPLYP
jgi:hypothetical protein